MCPHVIKENHSIYMTNSTSSSVQSEVKYVTTKLGKTSKPSNEESPAKHQFHKIPNSIFESI